MHARRRWLTAWCEHRVSRVVWCGVIAVAPAGREKSAFDLPDKPCYIRAPATVIA
jgi:hypothetical protein